MAGARIPQRRNPWWRPSGHRRRASRAGSAGRRDRGATIIEYALAISLIGTIAMGSVQAVTTGGEAVIDRAVNDVEGEATAVEGSGEIVEPEPTTTTTTTMAPTTTTTEPPTATTYTVAFANLSWWHHNAHWTPRVGFTFTDDLSAPVAGVTVYVRFGTNTTTYACTSNSSGVCTITGPSQQKNTSSVLMQGQGLTGTDLTYTGPSSYTVDQPA